jgi:hypothetical protein
VDMARLTYVGSAGLAVAVKLAERLRAAKGGLCMYSMSPNLKLLVETLGLAHFLNPSDRGGRRPGPRRRERRLAGWTPGGRASSRATSSRPSWAAAAWGSCGARRAPDGRPVALKIVLAGDPDALLRAAREQRLQGALGKAEGFVAAPRRRRRWHAGPGWPSSSSREGTLRERLKRGPLPQADALDAGAGAGPGHGHGPRARDHPPRPEAGEHPLRPRGAAVHQRPRPREALPARPPGGERQPGHDERGDGDRHPGLLPARAGPGRHPGRARRGRLRPGRDPPRGPHRPARLPGRPR